MKISGNAKGKNQAKKAGTSGKPSWALTGAEAKAKKEEYDAAAAERKEEQDKLWRWYIRPEEEGKLVFLNGEIVTEGETKGQFDVVFVEEHRVNVVGSKVPKFYVCTRATEPCPLCDSGNFAYFAGIFVVLDVTPYTNSEGKTTKYRKKIFAAKGQTIKRLAKKAKANGGSLVGMVLEASRSDQRSATVGDDFELVGQYPLERIGKGLDKKNWEAVVELPDIYEELIYLSAAELRDKFNIDKPSGPGMDTNDDPPNYGDDDDELPFGDSSDEDEEEERSSDKTENDGMDDLPF